MRYRIKESVKPTTVCLLIYKTNRVSKWWMVWSLWGALRSQQAEFKVLLTDKDHSNLKDTPCPMPLIMLISNHQVYEMAT